MNLADIKPEDIKELLKERLCIDSNVTWDGSEIVNQILVKLDGVIVADHQFSKRLVP